MQPIRLESVGFGPIVFHENFHPGQKVGDLRSHRIFFGWDWSFIKTAIRKIFRMERHGKWLVVTGTYLVICWFDNFLFNSNFFAASASFLLFVWFLMWTSRCSALLVFKPTQLQSLQLFFSVQVGIVSFKFSNVALETLCCCFKCLMRLDLSAYVWPLHWGIEQAGLGSATPWSSKYWPILFLWIGWSSHTSFLEVEDFCKKENNFWNTE